MQRLAFLFCAVAVVISTAFIIATGQLLPDSVAVHFDMRGTANRFMSREHYLVLFALLASALPLAMAGLTALALRRTPRLVRMRNRKFWMQPAYRDIAVTYLTARATVSAGVLSLLFAVIHYVVLQGNQAQPPQLPVPAFPLVVAAFLIPFGLVSLVFRIHMNRAAGLPGKLCG